MVPFFQINRLFSPCYLAFVTPKRIDAIDAIEQNAGSTLQVPHISKSPWKPVHPGAPPGSEKNCRWRTAAGVTWIARILRKHHRNWKCCSVYKYRSLNNFKYPIETLKHLSACQNICFLSRFPFRFKSQRTKTQETLHFFRCLLPVVLVSVPFIAFLRQRPPWVRQKRPHATKSPKYSVAMNREDAGSGSNFFWPRKWPTKMLQNCYRIDRIGRWMTRMDEIRLD